MATEKIHLVVKDSRRCSISAFGPHAIATNLLPHVRLEVVFVKVVAVVSIVSAKHVHAVLENDAGMGVSWAGALLGIQWLKLLPGVRLNAISMEVINTVIAVVATKDIDAASVDHSGVSISWTRWLGTAICIQLTPGIGRKVEAEEVIATIGSIVAAKDIEVVVKGD